MTKKNNFDEAQTIKPSCGANGNFLIEAAFTECVVRMKIGCCQVTSPGSRITPEIALVNTFLNSGTVQHPPCGESDLFTN